MKKIRSKMWETNSSSSHSIVIFNTEKGSVLDVLPVDDDGIVRIYPGEFNWSGGLSTDAQTKASYALTYAYGLEDNFLLIKLHNVIKSVTGAKKVLLCELDGEERYDRIGNIDHQSFDVCSPAFESDESLKNFIFNPKSTLDIDNDNH